MRKTLKVSLVAAFFSLVMVFSSLAGTWTQTRVYDDGMVETYEYIWFYVKDDGTYACNEWVIDDDGTRYWVEWDCALPIDAGVSSDGLLYDSDGKLASMEGRAFLTPQTAMLVAPGMTYDQVISVLGLEHDRFDEYNTFDDNWKPITYVFCCWFSQDGQMEMNIRFVNGIVEAIY